MRIRNTDISYDLLSTEHGCGVEPDLEWLRLHFFPFFRHHSGSGFGLQVTILTLLEDNILKQITVYQ